MGSTSVIGVPSSQCACSGHACTTRANFSAVAELLEWTVTRLGPQRHRPRGVVAPDGEEQERPDRHDRRRHRRRLLAREVLRVVREPAVLRLDDGGSRAECVEPIGRGGATAHRVDHEIGAQHAVVGLDADDLRDAVALGSRGEAAHLHAASHGDARVVLGGARVNVLHHRTAARDVTELVVVGSRLAVGDERREVGDEVHPGAAVGDQAVEHVGQLGLEDLAVAGEQVVWLAELRDARTIPTRPRLVPAVGHGRRVALEHRHGVAVAGSIIAALNPMTLPPQTTMSAIRRRAPRCSWRERCLGSIDLASG